MMRRILLLLSFTAVSASAQSLTTSPLPPIDSASGIITVGLNEFASLPDMNNIAARMMMMIDEPGTRRLFVNDMRGPIYSVSYDGKSVTLYVDINDSTWGVNVQSQGRERGLQSFAFHPQFAQAGTPGFGKFYTWTDSRNNTPTPDFKPLSEGNTHHMLLLEWTAKTPTAATYDGASPREIIRMQHPYANHNGGMIAFNTLARPGSADFGLLYVGVADGGSGGDPLNMSQNLQSAFGKIFRIDPMGRNSANGKYGIPATNPFMSDASALKEIYAYGVRNPQRFAWDPANGTMILAEIGQNIVEEVGPVVAGGNLGWNTWEGSFGFSRQGVDTTNKRGDPKMVWPHVEWMHGDPLFQRQTAATGVHIFRNDVVPALKNKVIFGDNPSGEVMYYDADRPPAGGSAGIHRVLFRGADGKSMKLLELIKAKNGTQGKNAATRADLRFGSGADGRLFLLNKADGTIRVIVP